jgi:Flp pilus assembly pilin Flp
MLSQIVKKAQKVGTEFMQDERGDGALDYVVLVVVVVAAVAAAAAGVLVPAIQRFFTTGAGKLDAIQ